MKRDIVIGTVDSYAILILYSKLILLLICGGRSG